MLNISFLIPIALFLVLGVVALYALQVAKNVAYVLFVILFGMLTWYVGAPIIRHYILNEQALSVLPPEEGKVARDIVDHFNHLPSKSDMEEAVKPALSGIERKKQVDAVAAQGEQTHAAASEDATDEPSLMDKIMKAVFQTIADSF